MEFLFKTRASVNPKGKPRVYFTCHPDDFVKHFQRLCDDILEVQDCAIYYTEDMSHRMDEQDQEMGLKQMSLFVVPVTFKLLTTPNRAMQEDIAYAKRHHIPILPFMMEPHIDHIYSHPDNFGECQYLYPDSRDTTQIPYKDRLKNYLNGVLISDTVVSRIKAAFDAYVFLSYRKKDRFHANLLLKKIHEIPHFRDTAIWYDEFLTPGESFKENISQILNKSQDFLLMVTPNLLEENNYVKDIEYPMAVNTNMPILPIEMVKTDRDALSKAFNGIPECIDPGDLSNRMLASSPTNSTSDADRSPEHLFLMGLAYLQGVDVEVNRERAIALITAAAEAGHREAIEKLYRLYSGEDGNAFTNQSKALKWGEKIVEYTQQLWGPQHPNTLTAKAKLAATLSALKQYEKAAEILEAVYRVRKEVLGETHPMTIVSLHNLAVELDHLNDHRKAIEIGKKVYRIRCLTLGEAHPDTITTLHNIALAYTGLGDLKKAVALLEKAYSQSKATAGEHHPNTMQMLESLADAYGKLGENQKGIELLAEAYDARTRKYGEASREACNALLELAVSCCKNGDFAKGFHHFDRAIALYAQTFGPKSAYVELAISKADNLGFSAFSAEAWDEAALFWRKALDLRRKAFGVWDSQIISIIDSLTLVLPDLTSPEKREAVLDCIFHTLMIMRNSIHYGTYKGDQADGFTKMHKLMRTYARHYQTPEKYIALLEMFYKLCYSCFGQNGKATVQYKQLLDSEKAKYL